MGISINAQTLAFVLSVAMGSAIGLMYDFLRILRGEKAGTIGIGIADVVFCLSAASSAIWFFMTVCEGEFRLYAFIGILMGVSIYFLTVSPSVIRVGKAMRRFVFLVFKALFVPFVMVFHYFSAALSFLQKIIIYFQKLFNYRRETCKMSNVGGSARKRRAELDARNASSQDVYNEEKKEKWNSY